MRISDWSSDVCSSDLARDAMTFALIDAALEKGLPTLFICRGFQELNAALGGTLHARLHEVEGRMDHRMRRVDDMDLRYGLRHAMSFTAGGRFEKIAGANEIQVNSLPGQGRSEDARVGKGGDSTCRFRWSPYHVNKKKKLQNNQVKNR